MEQPKFEALDTQQQAAFLIQDLEAIQGNPNVLAQQTAQNFIERTGKVTQEHLVTAVNQQLATMQRLWPTVAASHPDLLQIWVQNINNVGKLLAEKGITINLTWNDRPDTVPTYSVVTKPPPSPPGAPPSRPAPTPPPTPPPAPGPTPGMPPEEVKKEDTPAAKKVSDALAELKKNLNNTDLSKIKESLKIATQEMHKDFKDKNQWSKACAALVTKTFNLPANANRTFPLTLKVGNQRLAFYQFGDNKITVDISPLTAQTKEQMEGIKTTKGKLAESMKKATSALNTEQATALKKEFNTAAAELCTLDRDHTETIHELISSTHKISDIDNNETVIIVPHAESNQEIRYIWSVSGWTMDVQPKGIDKTNEDIFKKNLTAIVEIIKETKKDATAADVTRLVTDVNNAVAVSPKLRIQPILANVIKEYAPSGGKEVVLYGLKKGDDKANMTLYVEGNRLQLQKLTELSDPIGKIGRAMHEIKVRTLSLDSAGKKDLADRFNKFSSDANVEPNYQKSFLRLIEETFNTTVDKTHTTIKITRTVSNKKTDLCNFKKVGDAWTVSFPEVN